MNVDLFTVITCKPNVVLLARTNVNAFRMRKVRGQQKQKLAEPESSDEGETMISWIGGVGEELLLA